MRIKTTREKRILYTKTTVRWILYYVLILLFFTILTSGTFLKPMLLIPAAMCIAINNDIMASAFTGAVCGFLTDMACGRLFGYNAVLLTVFCAGATLIFELYLRNKFFNYLWITALASFLQCWLDYKFYYQMWGYDDVERIFYNVTLKVWIYTVIASVFIYLIFKLIDHFLMPREHLTIEEAITAKRTTRM
ncbi:MAG: rod shape-determining protein MreD [Ruminococcus sp.]|nr:rod shape-determining protein MreD [Ruminococcus sp.]